jgi:hypothetical protein
MAPTTGDAMQTTEQKQQQTQRLFVLSLLKQAEKVPQPTLCVFIFTCRQFSLL